jgi:hypothetical protein
MHVKKRGRINQQKFKKKKKIQRETTAPPQCDDIAGCQWWLCCSTFCKISMDSSSLVFGLVGADHCLAW